MKEHPCKSEDLTCDRTIEIITTFQTHIRTYIEKPNPVFGHMPICPFAQKARRDQKILYLVRAFQHEQDLRADSDLFDVIRKFRENESYEILIVIHPDQQAISLEEMKQFMQDLNQLIHPLGLISLSGHPLDDFQVGGVLTRRDPFINFIIQSQTLLESASAMLKSTPYYDNWTSENLDSIRFD